MKYKSTSNQIYFELMKYKFKFFNQPIKKLLPAKDWQDFNRWNWNSFINSMLQVNISLEQVNDWKNATPKQKYDF